ncbi:GTP pyrophosphokinase ppGpp synthetase I [Rubrivivax sp. A210]|uniref:RelA/SpoT family protein n=1 Tax=Rubrivivax sp. A210 TaxID=2772301 RepID=UPI001918089D|nr:bifunctional (p)ppGpp synthetase/guanosine-3',5'-bis(diphosphate) 3'-pyrophosphohydrolase [Rubrivivax sp. A210]CAD5367180.1 GTP pyrophosphokinase ppGpp synthetase I [Rubrivivax sp. A210]
MKTALDEAAGDGTAAIVHLAEVAPPGTLAEPDPVQRARAFAEPLLAGQPLDTGEDALGHADGTAAVLRGIGAAPTLCAAAYLVYAGDYLQRPEDVVRKAFGESYASLVALTRKLVQIQRAARAAQVGVAERAGQTERVRKMLLAFSRDLRVVLLRLASRLQTLRWYAATKRPCPRELATESLQVFAPLANRLGIWQIKWEMEDLSFRFLQPDEYLRMARLVDEKRAERERSVVAARVELATLLAAADIGADVQGRPKHLYSIWKKMQGKNLAFARVFDARALRVVVADVPACYAALARVHEAWKPVDGEFDDYIARPKPNGYQSLHTVVLGVDGRPIEVQIRTRQMHEHAEHGVAAHWMYKEAGVRGYAGVSAAGDFEDRVAQARLAVLRELLAWERDFSGAQADAGAASGPGAPAQQVAASDRIYVFTPQATIIDLPVGGTPVDFAYALHTDLGHRCRGAHVDGAMVPLNTALKSGQTVEVVAAKEGGPSLDWLNAELGYLASPRARAKVRAWFNAQAEKQTIARGREAVEKLLQREGRTAMERDALAAQLGFDSADALFEVVGKDEYSLRHIENLLRPPEAAPAEPGIALHKSKAEAGGGRGGVLVVGIDSLLTTLARCCRPAPPDAIGGFVTRGRGVAVHRRDCSNFRHMAEVSPDRVIEVGWGTAERDRTSVYPLDVLIEAADRPGLLRDISEVFAREKMNVTGAHTESARDRSTAWMTLTVEAPDVARLAQVLAQIARVAGVRHVRRK